MTSTLHSSHDAAQGDDDTVDEGTHLLLAASSASTISETSTSQTRQHALNILLSTSLSRLGSKTWEFATPLLLLEWSPGSLAAPAALGLTRALFQTLVSPHLGKMADQHWNRMSTVWIGTSMQAVGCLMSVCVLLLYNFSINVDGSNASMMHLLSLLLVIAAGVIESLGAQLSSVAVKKEWLPIIFSQEEANVSSVMLAERNNKKKMNTRIFSMLNIPNPITLSFINTTMTNIDLIAKMFGPVLAGWALEVLAHNDGSMQRGFVFIATINVVSFVPEIYLLRKVYQSCLALQLRCVDDDVNSMNQQKQTNSSIKKDDVSPWIIWINHPSGLPLLTLSLASLYMTALAPDGVVLTSYLVTIGMSPTSIGAFRGIGAVSGVLGICLFSLLRNNYDDKNESINSDGQQPMLVKSIERLRGLSLAFLLLEVVTILVAAAAFVKCDTTSIEKNESLSWQIYIFLGSIVVSRAGLYSFDVGVLEIEQWIVDERFRNAVGSVEGALCSLCEMGMYVLSIALPNPSQFGVQVGVSASAVSFGSICFGLFLCSYHMHLHHHHDDEDEYHDHNHSHGHHHNHHHHRHTLQQERDLAKQNGYHVHLHRHNRTWRFT
jgi:hypothetical protein